jgi:hypothetical protein
LSRGTQHLYGQAPLFFAVKKYFYKKLNIFIFLDILNNKIILLQCISKQSQCLAGPIQLLKKSKLSQWINKSKRIYNVINSI